MTRVDQSARSPDCTERWRISHRKTNRERDDLDPKTEKFESFPPPDRYASVRQLAGRKGEIWGAESGAAKLFVLKAE